jgi:GNAT superfamily N-acetyltransferase
MGRGWRPGILAAAVTAPVEFHLADPAAPVARELVAAMEDEIESLYGDRPGSIHSVPAPADQMRAPAGGFLLAVECGGEAVGCGGLKQLEDGVCEIKRMYLRPSVRGRGLAAGLLGARERLAGELGYERVRLDTGDRQAAAKHLYESRGYEEISDYNGNTSASHWYEKELTGRSP